MAAGLTSTATMTRARKLMVATALYVQTHSPMVSKLYAHKTLPKGMGLTYNEPYFASMTASSIAEGVAAATATQLTDNAVVVTPAEIIAQVEVTRRLVETASESIPGAVGKIMGWAMARKASKDGITTGQTFSTSLGAVNQSASVHLLGAAVAGMETGIATTTPRSGIQPEGDPAPKPYVAVLHPYHRFDLTAQLGGVGNNAAVTTTPAVQTFFPAGGIGSQFSAEVVRQGFDLKEVQGALVHFDGNLPITSGPTTSAFIAAREGLLCVDFRAVDTDQWWDQSKRTWLWTSTQMYGWAVRVDAWGRVILLDAAAPA